MNKGIINQSLLEKDIEQIIFYSKEENKSLNKICQKLIECSNNYSSTNTNLFLNNIKNLKVNVDKIASKRVMYPAVLNRVINQYNSLIKITQQKFNNGDVYYDR